MNTSKIEKWPVKDVNQNEKYEKIFLDQREGRYPVVRGTFRFGDLRSPVAVALATPDYSVQMQAIKLGACMVGSVNTSSIGIEYIVANTVSNPNIRHLIVYGKDGPSFHPLQSLICLKEFGIDKVGHIINTNEMWGAKTTNIEPQAVELFRKQIMCVADLIDEDNVSLLSNTIFACIQEPENARKLTTSKGKEYVLFDPGPMDYSPFYAPILEGKPGIIIDRVYHPLCSLIIAEDITQAYHLLWGTVRSQGNDVASQFGPTKELLNCVVQINNPLNDYLAVNKTRKIGTEYASSYMFEDTPIKVSLLKQYLERYFETLMTPTKKMVTFNRETEKYELRPEPKAKYTYGERLSGHLFRDAKGNLKPRNNLSIAIQALANSIGINANTRRCIIGLIDPIFDLTIDLQDIDPPCITTIFFNPRQIEKNQWIIYATMVMRSHDIRRAFIANVYAFAKLTEHVCHKVENLVMRNINREVKVEPGPITVFFVSAHEYLSFKKNSA